MKTKSHASKARVSKIPPKSHSMLALAISEMVRNTSISGDNPRTPPPTTSQRNPQNIINTLPDAIMLEAPHEGDPNPKAVMCNGKDCTLSIDECGGIDWFDAKLYCPLCSYKSAISQFEQLKKQVELALEIARAQRNCMYAFVAAGICTSQNAIAGGQEPVLVDTVQEPVLMDTAQEFERNSVGCDEASTFIKCDDNCDGRGEEVPKDRSDDNLDGGEENLCLPSQQVGRRRTDENNHDASVARVVNINPSELGKCSLGCDEASTSRKCNDNCDGGGEEALKDRSDDIWDGGEEDLGLPTQQVGRRRTDENGHDASVARVGNTNSRELRKCPLETSPGCDEASTSRKRNDNCDVGGEEPTKERSDDNLDGDEVDLGLPTQQVGRRSTDENNHDASVARAGNANPRKRPLETSPGYDEVSTSGNSAKSSGLNRKRQRWTPEEVEMLMEAVDKSSAKGIKNTSWKCVLEYGRHVFNASRTSIDLRDKWRTMTRGPRAKQT